MKRELAVWAEGRRVGLLAAERGIWRFQYSGEWIADPDRFPLSPRFRLTPSPVEDTSEERPVLWFFDNLLPEGGVRHSLARFAGIAERDSFGLLARFGEESAGALTLLPTEQDIPGPGRYEPLSQEDLRRYLSEQPDIPLIAAGGKAKMSLAGAQHKLSLYWNGRDFFIPAGAASSHILKPDNARPERYPFCPANEHFCMMLAGRAGLPAPDTRLIHLPEAAYLVARFDRIVTDGIVRRLHQIDLCQMLNKWPGYKYESEGGATFVTAYAALAEVRQPAVGRERLLRWLIFNYLIGNSDAHAKNVSFLVDPSGYELAPVYDLLSVKVYGDDEMAMSIGGEGRYGWVSPRAWDALADSLGVRRAFIRRLRAELASTVPALAKQLMSNDEFTLEERRFLEGIGEVIDQHAEYALEGL